MLRNALERVFPTTGLMAHSKVPTSLKGAQAVPLWRNILHPDPLSG